MNEKTKSFLMCGSQ